MNKYLIKYETYLGNVLTIEVYGYSQQHAESQLFNCKVIYWTKPVESKIIATYGRYI